MLALAEALGPTAERLRRAADVRYLVVDHALATVRFLPEAELAYGQTQLEELASRPEALTAAWRTSLAVTLYRDHGTRRPDLRLVDESGPPRLIGLFRRGPEVVFVDRALDSDEDLGIGLALEDTTFEGPLELAGGEALLFAAVRPAIRVFERVAGATIFGELEGTDATDVEVRARAILRSEHTRGVFGAAWPGRAEPDGSWEVGVPYDTRPGRVTLDRDLLVEVRRSGSTTWRPVGTASPPPGAASRGDRIGVSPTTATSSP